MRRAPGRASFRSSGPSRGSAGRGSPGSRRGCRRPSRRPRPRGRGRHALRTPPWAADLPGRYLSTLVESACREAGFEPRVVARLPSYELLLAHVEAGLSVALLPGLAVDPRYAVDARPLRAPRTRPVYAA
ncbi:LysR substrate-binding domain-containing protein, partial [Cellulosimicrobium funkei]|uniref:LysR substrate-binding domain-containing protein n=1 Tax=Cellulosimicrobium funkei TaxID=264251 RepID=UPI0037576520